MVEYDMHIHSTASDGILNADDIFQHAAKKKLKGISITDHDTVDSVDNGKELSTLYNIEFIPGIELSTEYKNIEVHILGYYIDNKNEEFVGYLNHFRSIRRDRAVTMVERLKTLGYNINFDELMQEVGSKDGTIGRPHVARVLVHKGYFNDIKEVFDNLIGNGKPAYVERYKVDTSKGIELIRNAGGIPVLAHPKLTGRLYENENLNIFIDYLVNEGIQGIEVYHSLQNVNESARLLYYAQKYNLLVTGGSDCHGKLENGEYLMGRYGISEEDFLKLTRFRR